MTENKKKWNVYHFLTTVLLVCMIIIFIIMSLIIRDILKLVEDHFDGFIDFIKNLLENEKTNYNIISNLFLYTF